MMGIFSAILVITIILLPFILIAMDIVFIVKKKENAKFEVGAFLTGIIYMFNAYMLWDLPDYESALNVYGITNAHEPVNIQYSIALLLFSLYGFGSYLYLKYGKKKLTPLIEAFMLAGVYISLILSGVFLIQIFGGANPQGIERKILLGDEAAEGMFLFELSPGDYLIILCLCVVPIIYIIHSVRLLVHLIKEKAANQENIVYDNSLLRCVNTFFCRGAKVFWLAIPAMIPVLAVLALILVVFGQRPDSVILAFTKTSDWILSGEIAPPPVAYDTHYLCTVSLRGHKKLVKPIRFGLRRGEKIVVNRQLCVANAFEQLLEEKTPKFHRAVRTFYDAYGYPISKHINSAWSADVVYLLMKPLEWIFVFVLYLFDTRPEDRISRQYLPKEEEKVLYKK